MTSLPIRLVRADLASVVRRAAAGERTIVTVAGQPVAQIGPLDSPHQVSLQDLVARGLVEAPRRRGSWTPPEPMTVWTGTRVDRLLREVRG